MNEREIFLTNSLREVTELLQRGDDLKVFISGTYDDLKPYRDIIATSLRAMQHQPFEPMENTSGHERVCSWAKRHIEMCNAYVGFFGVRYGSLIGDDPDDLSISEYEYEEACEKWGDAPLPPIFILFPEPGSALYNAILIAAETASRKQFQGNAVAMSRDLQRQRDFRSRLLGEKTMKKGVRITHNLAHESQIDPRLQELVRRYSSDILKYSGRLGAAALAQAPLSPAAPALPPPLPRLAQAGPLLEVIHKASLAKGVPGACIVVHGTARRGLGELARSLLEAIPWEPDEAVRWVFKSSISGNNREVWQTLWNAASASPDSKKLKDVDALATKISAEEHPPVVVLENVNLVSGGLTMFARTVWQPLYDRLAKLKGSESDRFRPLLIVLTYKGADALSDTDCVAPWQPDDTLDYTKLIALDALNLTTC